MKRALAALLLAVFLLAAGIPASAKTYVQKGVFSFEYPDKWENYGADESKNTEEYYEVAFICSRGYNELNVEVDLYYDEYCADVRLFDADEETLQDYASLLETTFYDVYSTEIVDAGGIPFIMIYGVDRDGDFIYAETVANGWCICFGGYAYADRGYTKMRTLTEDDLDLFREIVASVKPVREEAAQ